MPPIIRKHRPLPPTHSDHRGLPVSRPSRTRNVVHFCWEDDWIDDELGRRILIYRNTKAHENPDHELWRLTEYEEDLKTGYKHTQAGTN